VIAGPWVMRLKDRIDRAFMRRFQVLAPDGTLQTELAAARATMSPSADGEMPGEMPDAMLCGGCAAKVSASALAAALDRLDPAPEDSSVVLGLAERDDAAGYRTPSGDAVFTTLDAFRAFTDDPWLVGRVAALNALSDLYAKGTRPRFAQALVTVPADLSPAGASEVLYQALAGIRHELDRLGVSLLGGHSTTGAELLVGLVAGGFPEDGAPFRNDGLEPGDELVLTKPLGTGVLLHADAQGRATGPWLVAVLRHLLQANAVAAKVARAHGVHAATDVTGFGLAGHALELASRSGVRVELEVSRVPALAGARELLAMGLRSTSHAQNVESASPGTQQTAGDAAAALLHDPQTAGGLLLAAPPEHTASLLAELHAAGYSSAARVGRVGRRADGAAEAGIDLLP
jgi:selenide,water dikinase